ncbi:MAG: UDP-N-acetylmuramoyl-L-alanyl-D-glutamate--2,6-diaminopimelate ligase [Candidatus Brocadiales bacterium]
MKLAVLCNYLEGAQYHGPRDFGREITGIACDSREVVRGNLFVAIPGTHVDGHDFIRDALARGAAAVVTEKMVHLPENIPHMVVPSSTVAIARLAHGFYGEPSKRLTIIGITGTNGKTTTAYLLSSMLRASAKKVGLLGTIHYQVGDKLIDSTQTTPGPVELHRLFREMLDLGTTHVVMEVSSHALAQCRTHGIEFHGAVFTNLTMDHLDYHSSLFNYREAKAELFRSLPIGAFAVLNRDDYTSLYLSLQARARTFWYGLSNGSGVRAELIDASLGGMDIRLSSKQEEVVVSTGLMGSHNLCNILAAATAAVAMGVSLEDVKGGIESLALVPGRLERVATANGYSVFVDYAHTPDALEAVLAALRPLVKNRLLLVFGCGGDRDKGKRPLMGYVGERYSEYLLVTSDNPRTEQPMNIIRDIEKGISGKAYRVEPDRKCAIENAINEAREGDVVLIAGKGHEGTQVFSDRVIPFDDREIVQEILARDRTVLSTTGGEVVSGKEKVCVGVSLA